MFLVEELFNTNILYNKEKLTLFIEQMCIVIFYAVCHLQKQALRHSLFSHLSEDIVLSRVCADEAICITAGVSQRSAACTVPGL